MADNASGPGELADCSEELAELERGRLLFAASCEFFLGAQNLEQLPVSDRPEIAFAGRSNVGKSSLINALTGRHGLARASHQPGRTKQLNFFNLGNRVNLVDMPGYGYAKAAKSIKEDWQQLMFAYLRGRVTLARVVLLLDARVEFKDADYAVMELLDQAAVTYQLTLTKVDAVPPGALARKVAATIELPPRHAAAVPAIQMTSSDTRQGIPELRAALASLAAGVVGK